MFADTFDVVDVTRQKMRVTTELFPPIIPNLRLSYKKRDFITGLTCRGTKKGLEMYVKLLIDAKKL